MFDMKKKIALISVLLLSFSVTAMSQTYHLVRESPRLLPLNYLGDDGNPTGFETDLLKEIVNRSGIDIKEEFSPTFTYILEKVKEKEMDMGMSGITITEKRKELFDFSRPYFISHFMILTKDKDIRSFADLADKKVAVMSGSTHEAAVREVKGENADDGSIVVFGSSFLGIKAVLQGKVDAAVGGEARIFNYAEQYKDYGLLYVIDESYGDKPYGVLIQKGNTELKEKIDAAINSIIEDGTYKVIFKKWYPNSELPNLG